ncbi:MAG: helix-turn-helix transcriptional regulator [Kiritimatiellae bacterium]|nr:helix-turn-helix transcriptional regulator [Kiritimatiellia bacterium]
MSTPWAHLKHGGKSVFFPKRVLPLRAMLTSCGFSLETGRKTPYDWHGLKRGSAEFVLLQYTVAGRGELTYERHVRTVTPGFAMVLHIPHDSRYRLPPSSDRWEFFYVCMNGTEVVRIWKAVERQAGPLVHLPARSPTVACMVDIYEKAVAGAIRTPFVSSSLAYGLTMALLGDVMPAPDSAPERPPEIQNVLDFCAAHLADPIGVDEMAAVCGYSRYHFCRLFRESEKTPPGEYLTNLRMKAAIRLVQAGGNSVKEVALKCGYRDPNYFCKAFRKVFGTSPGSLRRSGM